MALWFIIPVIAVILFVISVIIYNKIRILSNRANNAWSQIDVQLKKRSDLVPNLVETVKGYVKHEKDAIKMVTEAREKMMKAGNMTDKATADKSLSQALKTIFAIAENYPNLKANENFKLLQEQLEGIENKIAYSRQFYNDSVLDFNNTITTIPGNLFAKMMGRTKPREYFEVKEIEKKPVKVEF